MTLPLSLWILRRLVPLALGAGGPSTPCHLPASEWLSEPAVGEGFAAKTLPALEGPLAKEMQAFNTHFEALYGQRTERASRETQTAVTNWVSSLPKKLDADAQETFSRAIRRWAGLYLRDTVPQLDVASKRAVSDKFIFLERAFSAQKPPLSAAFCLDAELATDAEDAKKTRGELLALKTQRDDLVEFSEELERQYLQRIRENPTAGDRLLAYAYFLFSVGRVEESEEPLRQSRSLTPKLEGIGELAQAIGKAKGMDGAVDRARFIGAFTNERRLAAEAKQRESERYPSSPKPGKRP